MQEKLEIFTLFLLFNIVVAALIYLKIPAKGFNLVFKNSKIVKQSERFLDSFRRRSY